jgi:hypothetical protein
VSITFGQSEGRGGAQLQLRHRVGREFSLEDHTCGNPKCSGDCQGHTTVSVYWFESDVCIRVFWILTVVVDRAHEVDEVGARLWRTYSGHDCLALGAV